MRGISWHKGTFQNERFSQRRYQNESFHKVVYQNQQQCYKMDIILMQYNILDII